MHRMGDGFQLSVFSCQFFSIRHLAPLESRSPIGIEDMLRGNICV